MADELRARCSYTACACHRLPCCCPRTMPAFMSPWRPRPAMRALNTWALVPDPPVLLPNCGMFVTNCLQSVAAGGVLPGASVMRQLVCPAVVRMPRPFAPACRARLHRPRHCLHCGFEPSRAISCTDESRPKSPFVHPVYAQQRETEHVLSFSRRGSKQRF